MNLGGGKHSRKRNQGPNLLRKKEGSIREEHFLRRRNLDRKSGRLTREGKFSGSGHGSRLAGSLDGVARTGEVVEVLVNNRGWPYLVDLLEGRESGIGTAGEFGGGLKYL